MKKVVLFVLSAFLIVQMMTAQSTGGALAKDGGAVDLISMGKRFLRNNNYPQALRMFEDAMTRSYNQSTTSAIYLCGLTYYQMGDFPNANQYFDLLAKEYPKSKYVEEAKYHQILMKVKGKDEKQQIEGLKQLLTLSEQVADGEMVKECQNIINNFLYYQANANVAKSFYVTAPPEYKLQYLEAACYRLVQEDRKDEAKTLISEFTAKGGKTTEFLDILMAEKKTFAKIKPKNIAKIAMFLPLFVDNVNVEALTEIPAKSQVALEFYEGFKQALEEYAPTSKKQIYLKIYDTQRDNTIIGTQLADLEDLYPDMIIGEVYNRQSRVLADWTDSKGVPQIVPLSPTLQLTQGKANVFLARPSAATHGKKMANYAYYNLGLRKVAVWNDKKSVTVEMASAFEQEFKQLGGTPVPFQIDSLYQRAIGQIPYVMNGIKNQGCDGMYTPMAGEETIGLILSYLGASTIKVMAAPDIENFFAIDRELKEKIGIYFTTSYLPNENSIRYVSYYNAHLEKYGTAPTETNIRGYDLGMYVLPLLDEYTPEKGTLSDFIRNHPKMQGLHIDYNFEKQQDNQAVHIMQFTGQGTLKRN